MSWKIMFSLAAFFLTAFFSLSVGLSAQAGFQADLARPDLTFKAKFSDGGEWDIGQDLNISSGSVLQAQLFVNERLRLSYGDFLYEGIADMKRIGPIRGSLQTAWDLEYVGIGYFHPLFVTQKTSLEGIFDVKGYRLTSKATGAINGYPLIAGGLSELKGIAPAVGIRLTQSITERFDLFGEIIGLPLGDLASYLEWNAGANYEIEDIAMQVGYRVVDVSAQYGFMDSDLKARFAGPYAGIRYVF